MAHLYCPDAHADRVRAYIRKLESCDKRVNRTKEERKRKKKNQKEINKKEESTNQPARKIRESSSLEFIKPTIDEIKDYVIENALEIDAESFFNYYDALGWMGSNNRKIKNWQSLLKTWQEYEQRVDIKPKRNEKRKSKSDNASANGRDGGSESGKPQDGAGAGTAGGAEAKLSRRELVEKLLAEEYPVDEGKSKELERVLAGAVECAKGAGGGTGTDLAGGVSLDHLAARYGANEVICWVARAILERAENPKKYCGNYDGDRIVKDARSYVMNVNIYHGRLTARLFLDELYGDIGEIGTSTLGKAIYNKTRIK